MTSLAAHEALTEVRFVLSRIVCLARGHKEVSWPEPGWIACGRCKLIPGHENRPHRRWWQPT